MSQISDFQNQPHYAVAKSLSEGNLPTTTETQSTLHKLETALHERAADPTLTSTQQKIAGDTAAVLQSLETNIEEKNKDGKLQNLVNDFQSLELAPPHAVAGIQDQIVGTWTDFKELLLALVRSRRYREALVNFLTLMGQVVIRDPLGTASSIAGGQFQELIFTQLTPDEREKLLDQFVISLQGFTSDKRFHRAFYGFIHLFEKISQEPLKAQIQSPEEERKVTKLYLDSKDLLERFTSPKTLDDIITFANQMYMSLQSNGRAIEYYRKLRRLLLEIFDNPSLLKDSGIKQELSDMIDLGRELSFDKEIRFHFNRILDEANSLLDAIANNPSTKQMRDTFNELISNFVHEDSFGNRQIDPNSFQELVNIILPMIRDSLEHLKLPRIDGSDANLDWAIDEAVLYGRHILPDYIDIRQSGELLVRLPGQTRLENLREQMTLVMDHVYFTLRDIKFHYKQKTGLVQMSDDVLADLEIRGRGAKIELSMEYDNQRGFRCKSANCNIDSMVLKIQEAKHNILYTIFRPFLESRVKLMIEQGVENAMTRIGDEVGAQLEKTLRGVPVLATASEALLGK